MKKLNLFTAFCLLAVSLFNTPYAAAQDAGDIDTGWGNSGWLLNNFVDGEGEIYHQLHKLSDDRFMMVGQTNTLNMDVILAAYNNDGTLDTEFGNMGVLQADISLGLNDAAFDIVELWDGKILVAGSTTTATAVELFIMRILSDGQVDNSFGTDGMVRYNAGPGSWCIPTSIVVSESNNIFVGASTFEGVTWDFSVMKLTQGGGFVSAYGEDGVVIISEETSNDELKSMHVTATEEVYFVGNVNYGGTQGSILAKLDNNGMLDPEMNTIGFVYYDNSAFNYFNDLLVDESGNILVAGHEGLGYDVDGFIFKYLPDGTLDLPFGINGKITMDIGGSDGIYYNRIEQMADGNYIVTGQAAGLSLKQIHAFTFDASGSADCAFACAGVYHDFPLSVIDMRQTLLEIMDDGSILTGGNLTSEDFVGENMFIAKLLVDSPEDTTTVALNELTTFSSSLNLYPNPATDYFILSGVDASSILQVRLLDLNGRIMQVWEAAANNYLLEQITPGTYLMQCVTTGGVQSKLLSVQ